MKAEIISIGHELLNGSKHNSNSVWLAGRLRQAGIEVCAIATVGDDPEAIQAAMAQGVARSDVVIMTGGLGPTHDDVTRDCVAAFYSLPLVENAAARQRIIKIFADRGKPMPESNLSQALVPEGAQVLENDIGTAPGLYLDRRDCHCFVLPGVPQEMERMTEKRVIPILTRLFGRLSDRIHYQRIRTTGISESGLFEKLTPLADIEKFAEIAFLPHRQGEDITLRVVAEDKGEVAERLAAAVALIRTRAGAFIYEIGERTLEQIIADHLGESGATLATAESCTGGLIASLITDVPGSSAFFRGGVVAYDNAVKTEVLQVPPDTIARFGAVSPETARAMAAGVRVLTRCDYGLATTGIAGPSGGSRDKPVGTVYVAVADAGGATAVGHVFHKDRLINKSRFAYAALHFLHGHVGAPSDKK